MMATVPLATTPLPTLVATAGERTSLRFLEFFAANIRNPHTRRAYYRAAEEFLAWCASAGVKSIGDVHPVHVATWIEASTLEEYLTAYLDGAGLRDDPKGPLFRTIGRATGKLTRTVLPKANAYAMIRRRGTAAGLKPSSATTASERPGSRPISRTAGRWRRALRRRTMPQPARRSSIIAGAMKSAWMKSSGL
jgi:hypothetical protein